MVALTAKGLTRSFRFAAPGVFVSNVMSNSMAKLVRRLLKNGETNPIPSRFLSWVWGDAKYFMQVFMGL